MSPVSGDLLTEGCVPCVDACGKKGRRVHDWMGLDLISRTLVCGGFADLGNLGHVTCPGGVARGKEKGERGRLDWL